MKIPTFFWIFDIFCECCIRGTMKDRLQEILRIALEYGVSDVHFDLSNHQKITIEMRIKGEMKQLIPKEEDIRLFHYLMYRANLDVSDISRPQTGSFKEVIQHKELSLRFSFVSSYYVKSGVLRILNTTNTLTMDALSYEEDTKHYLHQITQKTNGLFLFAGPTGSGKTTTVYTLLNETKGKKIFSLEDPVEVVNEKYVQIQINEKQHLSYADGIKQLMRHDPDIIMIGEIRDELVAQMAVRCALTGHLVISTIHSFSCMSTILRMLDLGVDRYQLQDVLKGVSSQRLFVDQKNQTFGIYEFMNEKQLLYYFEKGEIRDDFKTIQQRVTNFYQQKIISFEQAKPYITD